MTRTPLFLALGLATASALSACEAVRGGPPAAVGDPSTVMVVADSATLAGPVGDALRGTLGRPLVPLPGSPGAFRLQTTRLDRVFYDQLRNQRFVVFAAPYTDDTTVGRYLAARTDSAGRAALAAGSAVGVTVREDLWARGQIVVFATAATDSALATAIRERFPALLPRFETVAREAVGRDMFARAEQTDIADSLLQRHDFAVRVQHDYLLVQDTALRVGEQAGRFVRLRRVLTDTWRDFFVYYEDGVGPERADAAAVEALTDELLERLVRGSWDSSYVAIERTVPIRTDTTRVAGRPARHTRGLWRMTGDLMGGPFTRFTFYDPGQRRLYVLFGMVFAPNPEHDKRAFLRQVEAMAHSFRPAPAAGNGPDA